MIDSLLLIKAAFVALLLLAAYSDARRLLIPNIYPALLFLLGIVAWVAGFPFFAPLWSHLAHFALALGIGLLLFRFGWFGGGDVKLYAALALWFGLGDGILLLFVTGLGGAAIVALSITFRLIAGLLGFGGKGRLFDRKRRIAYGIAIAAGGIASLFWVYP